MSVSILRALPRRRSLVASLLALVFLLPLTASDADAQILNKLKKRAQEAAERAADRSANQAADRATERASQAAGNAVGDAAANAAGLPPGAMGGGSLEGLADFRELQALVPASFAGLARTDLTGEATAAMGMSVSTATGRYDADERSVTLSITDTGTMRGFLTMSAAWMGMTVDQQTSTGFTRTTTIGEMPAYVQEDRDGGLSSSVQVVVSDRLLVSAEANGVAAAEQKAAVETLDFDALAQIAATLAEATVPLVPFDELITFLPAHLDGFTRAAPTGETGGVAGLEMSQAAVVFSRGDETIDVTILDLGSLSGATALTYAAWLSVPISKQSTEGFERTTRFGAHPGYEQQTNEASGGVSSQVQVAPGRRFLVTAQGNVSAEVLRALVGQADLDALARRAEIKGDN